MTPLAAHLVQYIDARCGVCMSIVRDLNWMPTGTVRSARHAYAYALRHFAGWSLLRIADFLNVRSHSSIRAWSDRATEDPAAMALVQSAVSRLREERPDLYLEINACDKIAEIWRGAA